MSNQLSLLLLLALFFYGYAEHSRIELYIYIYICIHTTINTHFVYSELFIYTVYINTHFLYLKNIYTTYRNIGNM